jgi:hypothetical protein
VWAKGRIRPAKAITANLTETPQGHPERRLATFGQVVLSSKGSTFNGSSFLLGSYPKTQLLRSTSSHGPFYHKSGKPLTLLGVAVWPDGIILLLIHAQLSRSTNGVVVSSKNRLGHVAGPHVYQGLINASA